MDYHKTKSGFKLILLMILTMNTIGCVFSGSGDDGSESMVEGTVNHVYSSSTHDR